MKDTKSSAAKKESNNLQRLHTIDDSQMQTQKLTPSKSKKTSPLKSKRDSASKMASKASPQKDKNFEEHFTLDTKFRLDEENEGNEYSLEGIAGMVRITPGKDKIEEKADQFYSLPVQ